MNVKDFVLGFVLGRGGEGSSAVYEGTPVLDTYGDEGDPSPFVTRQLPLSSSTTVIDEFIQILNQHGWTAALKTTSPPVVSGTFPDGESFSLNLVKLFGNNSATLVVTDNMAGICNLQPKTIPSWNPNAPYTYYFFVIRQSDHNSTGGFSNEEVSGGYLSNKFSFKQMPKEAEMNLYRLYTSDGAICSHAYTTPGLVAVKDLGSLIWINHECFFALSGNILYKIRKEWIPE